MFQYMEILTFRAEFAAEKEGELPPYLGSTLRGILGHCMRNFACIYVKNRCNLCQHRKDCAYAQCFCSPGNIAGSVNPFVIYPVTKGKTKWKRGDICEFEVSLIGKIIKQAGFFLDALEAMENLGWGAERIPFSLRQIIEPHFNTILFAAKKTWFRNIKTSVLNSELRPATAVLIRFDTPVRILESKTLCDSLPFEVLIRSLSRRLSLLTQAYTDQLLEWDTVLYEKAKEIETVKEEWQMVNFSRYSMNHKNNTLALPAIQGWVLYQGDLEIFTPLLQAGNVLHVGKNSTIGFGHYNIYYDK